MGPPWDSDKIIP